VKIVSLFAGSGGLDLGFSRAGFDVVWANEYDRTIWATYRRNFPDTRLDTRSITDVDESEIPDCDGVVGGPPCQSWSEAGALRGIGDRRGQLFYEYLRVLTVKQPRFFLAENVSGILFSRHSTAVGRILESFTSLGYNVSYGLLNANHFGVPQDRERVIIVGYKTEYGLHFSPPQPANSGLTLSDAILDLKDSAVQFGSDAAAGSTDVPANHEYMPGGFSPIFMSRNRVRRWDQPSFTIQAGARHAPLHPQAPPMVLVGKDRRGFVPGSEHLYRRLTVRECARIQTFPDSHIFVYDRVSDGYKMVGNAVPVEFARQLALKISHDLRGRRRRFSGSTTGSIRRFDELEVDNLRKGA
jgi:DNA (cytosine-5)-methyltransferase 1